MPLLLLLPLAAGVGPARAAKARCLLAVSRSGYGQTIAVYDTAAGRTRDVTFGDGEDSSPSWSPDGDRIAFARMNARRLGGNSKSHVWIVDLAGDERQLTVGAQDDYAPAWSPDGRRIAFTRGHGIYLVSVATRRVSFLAHVGLWNGVKSWSPDGRWLAFDDRAGVKVVDLRNRRVTLRVPHADSAQYLADGTLAYRVGSTFVAGKSRLTSSLAGYPARWTPDGSRLAFGSAVDEDLTSPPPSRLYVERAGAARPRHLDVAGFRGEPAWRPSC